MKFRLTIAVVLTLSSLGMADQWTKNYKVGGKPQLTIYTSDAAIEVHAGAEGTITADLETQGYRLDGNDPDMRVTESQAGDNVSITVKERHETHWCIACSRNAHMNITAPAGTRLMLRTSDGSLKVFDIKAAAELNTSDGSIEIRGFDGALHAHSSDGSITAAGRFDDLRLETSDGSINVQVERGSKVSTDWRLHSSDGSIRVALPDDLAADMNMSTGDGSIHTEMSLNDVRGPASRSSLSGKLNGGGRLFEIRTSDGSIHLSRL